MAKVQVTRVRGPLLVSALEELASLGWVINSVTPTSYTSGPNGMELAQAVIVATLPDTNE